MGTSDSKQSIPVWMWLTQVTVLEQVGTLLTLPTFFLGKTFWSTPGYILKIKMSNMASRPWSRSPSS